MNLPPDVPIESAEGRRLLREMAVGLIALAEGHDTAPKVIEVVQAKPTPPPPVPSAPPKESAEGRRLVKEAALASQKMIQTAAKENTLLLKEAAKKAKAELAAMKVSIPKPRPVAIPKDVPAKSAEARRIRKDSDDNSNGLIGKRIYKAPIKFVKFAPKFDNQPMSVARVG